MRRIRNPLKIIKNFEIGTYLIEPPHEDNYVKSVLFLGKKAELLAFNRDGKSKLFQDALKLDPISYYENWHFYKLNKKEAEEWRKKLAIELLKSTS